jgi:hypothetical protein
VPSVGSLHDVRYTTGSVLSAGSLYGVMAM